MKAKWPTVIGLLALTIGFGLFCGFQARETRSAFDDNHISSSNHNASEVDSSIDSMIVYITRTGECYHRAGCSYLRMSKIPIQLNQARKYYRPCSRCKPPK